ncbi:MAG TPA: hypothetical protein VKX28_29580 [Xanthobacteraceae bacterium]|nr:hypothetical protein [Xanthobacteraceae bacterium]
MEIETAYQPFIQVPAHSAAARLGRACVMAAQRRLEQQNSMEHEIERAMDAIYWAMPELIAS